ncbi:MAG: hypothetical protein KH828_11255 [Clostridiales bacterium]|nr:hypothetical protein [Clostridiales bacterium]
MVSILKFIEEHWVIWLFGVINVVVSFSCQKVMKSIKNEKKSTAAIMDGTRALLRSQLLMQYNHYYEELKYCPVYALENIDELYFYYTQLGGNGTISQLVKKIRTLPISLEE